MRKIGCKMAAQAPACYNAQPPPASIEKIHAFSDETLFHILHHRTADAKLQEQAVYTLTLRGWRYLRQEGAWIIRDKHPIAPDVYIKFDTSLWMPLRHRIPDLKDSMLDPLPRDSELSPLDPPWARWPRWRCTPPEFDEIWRGVVPPAGIRGGVGGRRDCRSMTLVQALYKELFIDDSSTLFYAQNCQ